MINYNKYFFEDFTQIAYRELLKLAKQNFNFSDFESFNKEENFILWRHDVDYSLELSLELAKIEHSFGVRSTFFILLHSDFYNPLEANATEIIREILLLGHKIGLHFDAQYYNISNENELDEWIVFEKNFLEKILKINITTFSFHNTNPFVLSCKKETYGGLTNTYQSFFQDKADYCSDSHGIWRFKRLKEVLEKKENLQLQVLTHPEWWTKEILSPKEKIWKNIDDRALQSKNNYRVMISQMGVNVIDW